MIDNQISRFEVVGLDDILRVKVEWGGFREREFNPHLWLSVEDLKR